MVHQKDLIMPKKYAEIREIGKEEQENCIRVYCCQQTPKVFTFQIRTHNPTKQGGVNRQMIANVNLSIDELKKILKYMEREG